MRHTLASSATARALLSATMLLVIGCSDNAIGPENELEVANETDTFQWQVTALDKVTQTLTYTWAMTGTVADVNQSANPSGGTATLRIRDSAGVEVFFRSLADNGTFQTSSGTAGNWTVTVTLDGVSGAVNFRVQKP